MFELRSKNTANFRKGFLNAKCGRCETLALVIKLKPHYGKTHTNFIKQNGKQSKEEQITGMQKRMDENKTRFEENK